MAIKERPSGHTQDAIFSKPRFGSKETQEMWDETSKTARTKQHVKIAVAPECAIETVFGVSRKPGEELTVQELGGHGNLEQLEKAGIVIHLTESELKINLGTARNVVIRKAISHGGRIYVPGDVVEAEDFDLPDEPEERYADSTGRIHTRRAITHPSGEEMLRRLVKRGLIKELKRAAAVKRAVKAAQSE